MEFLYEYGLFLLKAVTVVVALIVVITSIVSASQKNKQAKGELDIQNLSEGLEDMYENAQALLLDKQALKKREKEKKKKEKAEAKEKKTAAKLMFQAETQHGHKTVAAQTKWADDQQEMFDARVARGTAKGALAAAKQNALAAEVAFKTWQTEMATTRAEMRTLMG